MSTWNYKKETGIDMQIHDVLGELRQLVGEDAAYSIYQEVVQSAHGNLSKVLSMMLDVLSLRKGE